MSWPRISVIVPATHAAGTINALVDHIRVVGYGMALEIVVADGDPAGSTLFALSRQGVTALTAGPGPADRQNAGAREARGDILLFLPVETRLPVGAFQAVAEALAGTADAGAFSLAFRPGGLFPRLAAGLANLRSRLCGLPSADQALFVRRELFTAVGGFPDIPELSDVALVRNLARAGARIAILRQTVTIANQRLWARGPWRMLRCNLARLGLLFRPARP